MIEVVKYIIGYSALILYGCLCGFFMVCNWIKQEERRKEQKNGKLNK